VGLVPRRGFPLPPPPPDEEDGDNDYHVVKEKADEAIEADNDYQVFKIKISMISYTFLHL
jgi:hypothetical protein